MHVTSLSLHERKSLDSPQKAAPMSYQGTCLGATGTTSEPVGYAGLPFAQSWQALSLSQPLAERPVPATFSDHHSEPESPAGLETTPIPRYGHPGTSARVRDCCLR